MIPKNRTVSLADPNQQAKIIGEVVINITINGTEHSGIVVEVIDHLFIDLIIGKDILTEHEKVILNFKGPRKQLGIGAVQNEHETDAEQFNSDSLMNDKIFPTMNVPPPPLFVNLSKKTKPIATKSRFYTKIHNQFLRTEAARLLREGVIEPSVSPWRAQALVTKNENHKRRMAIDYSDTINLFTELDAYPMPK